MQAENPLPPHPSSPWSRNLSAETAQVIGTSVLVTEKRGVKCFGRNAEGQLGYGDVIGRGDGPGSMGESLLLC